MCMGVDVDVWGEERNVGFFTLKEEAEEEEEIWLGQGDFLERVGSTERTELEVHQSVAISMFGTGSADAARVLESAAATNDETARAVADANLLVAATAHLQRG